MKIDIRRAGITDDALLSELASVTFLNTFIGTCTDDDIHQFVEHHFSKQQLHSELLNPLDFYFIAFINGRSVGYLQIKEAVSEVPLIKKYKAIELKRIYVLKEFLDKKVGAALMEFTIRFAAENNYEAVWLGVWEHNERAKAFYKKWGFTDTGYTHDFPIGNTPQTDQWLMKLIGKHNELSVS